MSSRISARIDAGHSDYIHDVCYDYYGTWLATCGSDRKINVFEKQEDGSWKKLWTVPAAHEGPILKLAWAHPEFGSVLASCSVDHSTIIWEGQELINEETGKIDYKWKKATGLGDARLAVNDIAFAPSHFGLRLAIGSGDGHVRVYEAPDPLKLTEWQMQNEFLADSAGVRCLSWNDSREDDATLVVGGASKTANIWSHNEQKGKWLKLAELRGHTDHIHDTAWAPSMGRSFHRIATASRDHTIRIWQIKPADFVRDSKDVPDTAGTVVDDVSGLMYMGKGVDCYIYCFPSLMDHYAEVWRVRWNVTGSVLASSGDDGVLRVWKQNLRGAWVCVSQVASSSAPPMDESGDSLDNARLRGMSQSQLEPAVEALSQNLIHG
eukprot:gb/GECG01004123.1/.p1 GENE.gb/GECG01004123.1/~~gb/GECG01004123.1/.p1  ORF type:complete len:379 (+),score=43.15 gb/GECG01004123.1/:1-1137(+)